MLCVIFLVASAVFVQASGHLDENILARLDLKNYDQFQSERESTSTSSTDSSSDAKRIARAVEAALEAAEMAPAQAPRAAQPFSTLRLRLGTTNKAGQCGEFSCDQLSRATSSADIQGVRATVQTSQGQSFTATFNAAGVATHVRDNFFFQVTYTFNAAGDSFLLETQAGQFGVNVTSIDISSPLGGRQGPNGMAYFDLESTTAFDEETGLNADETLQATIGSSIIGCNAQFDGVEEQGSGSFSVSIVPDNDADREFIVSNSTTGPLQTTFGGNVFLVDDSTRIGDIGLLDLPCATRGRVIYDQIAIMTKRAGTTTLTAETLKHPLIYDQLVASSSATNVDFERLVFELRVAAGRTQLRLRDITLDTGAFSDLSHKSKFTPCFRVFPDEDYQIEVLIGMRGGTGQVVRALLQDPNNGPNLVQGGQVVFDPETPPLFEVVEVAFEDLVGDQTDTSRPFELLPSDVDVELEECPSFTYFA